MEIVNRRREGSKPTGRRTATFTGDVYADGLLDGGGVAVNSVLFTPGGRTYWHSHEHGQVLHVVSGRGLACAAGGVPQQLHPGDVVWAPPGEVHWHGGGPDSMLLHLAVSLGSTNWLGPVSDADYGG
jgi:quercetin dioxygenase-like cupin family protein